MYYIVMLIMANIACVFGWVITERELRQTKKLLEAAQNTSTPIKELTSNFRDFVQSIDGHVSPEVDAAIKKLEEEQKPKLLPPPAPAKSKKTQRAVISVGVWNLFVADFKAAEDSDEKISVIRRWGKRYIFTLKEQVELVSIKTFDDYEREELREYFEEDHSTSVISIGS